MNYEIHSTVKFNKWLRSIKDRNARDRLTQRIANMRFGHFGDYKRISKDLFELRFFFGSGYRVYYTLQGKEVILLLCGGDKSSQYNDIVLAKKLLKELE
jgi:putative addiction module killer protein